MRKTTSVLALAGAAAIAGAVAHAQPAGVQVVESGSELFKRYCASCHGSSAKGDGPIANALRYRPADLTQVAKRNHDSFDAEKVHRMIDGRDPVKGHGGPDMPLWGDAFKRSGDGYSEDAVKARIDALVEYLQTIQEK